MSTITIAKPPAGQRVRITAMPGGYHIGEIGTVTDAYSGLTDRQIGVIIDGEPAPSHQNGVWIVDAWETIYPEIGDKVIPLADNGNWYGIPEQYRTIPGTVAEIGDYVDGNGKRFIAAEFPSYRKPDDFERWSFYWCVPADETPAEYTPTLHETVRMTGYLAIDGIRDVNDWIGEVIGIDNGVWTVRVEHTNYPSGPGYVFPIKDGETVTVSTVSVDDRLRDLDNRVDTLTRELARANERVEELRDRASKWERDFLRYANRIKDEANDRDWCSEYDRIMDEISGDLEIAEIPKRRNRRRVRVRVRGEVYRDLTVWVDEDEDTDDPDNWYEEEDSECSMGSDGADEQIASEYDNNGFDSVEYETR